MYIQTEKNAMDFCDFCNNMYYIKQQEDSTLIYFCKNCGSTKHIDEGNENSKKISHTDYDKSTAKYSQYLNPNIVHDKTIPHVNNIICSNEQCTKKDSEDNDVMYIKFDEVNIRYLYHCVHCKHFWTL